MKYITYRWKRYIKYSYLLKNRWECIKYIWKWKYKTCDEPIIFFIDYNKKDEYVIIPPWFEFNFNSSPSITHFIVDKDEFAIALIHDYLYNRTEERDWYMLWIIKYIENINDIYYELERTPTRREADKIWLKWAIVENEVIFGKKKKLKPILWYLWLRLFWRFARKR